MRKPTRGDQLLDLALRSVPCAVRSEVLPKIIDQCNLLTLNIPQIQKKVRAPCLVWDYRDAQWDRLKEDLDAVDWNSMKTMSANAATSFLT